MRILFKIICLILLSTSAMSQVQQPSNFPSSGSVNNWTVARYTQDSGKLFIERDTFPAKYPTLIKHLDHKFYYSNGNGGFWFPLVSAGAGTVYSIATNNGTYITGGTITGSGTLTNDTTGLATRAWATLDHVLSVQNYSGRSARLGSLSVAPLDIAGDRLLDVGGLVTTSTSNVQYGSVFSSPRNTFATGAGSKTYVIKTGIETTVGTTVDSAFAIEIGRTNVQGGSSVTNRYAIFQRESLDKIQFNTSSFALPFLPSSTSGGLYAVLDGSNQLSTRTAAQLKTDIAAGDGTVTSVGLTSSDIVVGGSSPITTSGTYTLTLTNTLITPGTFGSSFLIPIITVDAKGRVTSITSTAFTVGSGTLTSWSFTNNTYFIGTTINATSTPQFSLSPSSNALYITNVGTLFGLTVLGNVSGTTFLGSGTGLTGIVLTAQGTPGQISSTGTQNVIFNLADVNNNIGAFNNVTLNAKGQATSATNVAYLTNNQTITFTASGDVTASATGTTAISPVFTLTNVLVTPGTFGSSSQIPVFTVDAKGRVTGITSVAANVGTVTSFSFTNSAFFIGTTLSPGTTPQLSISPSANATYITSVGTLFSLTVANSFTANSITSAGYVLAYSYVFNPVSSPSFSPWSIVADAASGQFLIMTNNPNLSLNVGYEQRVTVMNNTGSIITNGSAVYKNGSAVGENGTVALAQANALSTTLLIGVATESIGIGMTGSVTYQGIVHGVNTSTYNKGDKLYLDPTTPGALTNVAPTSPNLVVLVGEVGVVSASTGTIYVAPYYLPSTIAGSGVISITGTQSQILASATTGSVTLTLSPALILPGSLTMSAGFTNTGTTSLSVTTLLTTTITGNLVATATSILTIISTTLGPTARADIAKLSVITTSTFGGASSFGSTVNITGPLTGTTETLTGLFTGATGTFTSMTTTVALGASIVTVSTTLNAANAVITNMTATTAAFSTVSISNTLTAPNAIFTNLTATTNSSFNTVVITGTTRVTSITATGLVQAPAMSAATATFSVVSVQGNTTSGSINSNTTIAAVGTVNGSVVSGISTGTSSYAIQSASGVFASYGFFSNTGYYGYQDVNHYTQYVNLGANQTGLKTHYSYINVFETGISITGIMDRTKFIQYVPFIPTQIAVGIAVTPSPWDTANNKVIDLNTAGAIYGTSTGFGATSNIYFDGTNWKYKTSTLGGLISATGGDLIYSTVPTGTAGNTATLTEKFHVYNTGYSSFIPNVGNYSEQMNIYGNAPNGAVDDISLGFNASSGSGTAPVRVNTGRSAWAITPRTSNADVNSAIYFAYQSVAGVNSLPLSITATGAATFLSSVTATSFITSSDARLKNEKQRWKSKDGIDFLKYTLKSDNSVHYGYFAQEVAKILPSTVIAIEDSTMSDGKRLALNYTEILSYKNQQLEERINKVEAYILILEKQIDLLKKRKR